jgi:hypothetical protein
VSKSFTAVEVPAVRRLLPVLLVLGLVLTGPVVAQQYAYESFPLVTNYNLTATSFTYPVFNPILTTSTGKLTTVGSSTTITPVAGQTIAPLAPLGIGDELIFRLPDGTTNILQVTACTPSCGAAATSITVGTAIDLTFAGAISATVGVGFQYRHLTDGTGVNQGWVSAERFTQSRTVIFNVIAASGVVGGIIYQVECRSRDNATASVAGYISIGPTTLSAFPTARGNLILETCSQVRVGMKLGTSATSTQITVTFDGVKVS